MSRPTRLSDSVAGVGSTFRYFWPKIREHSGLLAASTLALLAEIVLRLLEPWPIQFVVDRILVPGAMAPAGFDAGHLLIAAAVAVLVLSGLRALAAYGNVVGFALVGNRVISEIRSEVYRHLQRLSLGFHHRARGGDLVIRVIGDTGLIKDVVITAALPLVSNVLVLVGMVGVMLWMNWKLTLLALAVIPLFWLRTVRLNRRIQSVARDQRRREGALAATAAESFSAMKVVQALSLEEVFAGTFSGHSRKSIAEGAKAKRLEAGLERTVDVLVALSTAVVLWYGALLVLRQELTAGELLVFLTYQKNAFRPVRDFAKYSARLSKAAAAGERVLDLLQQTPEVRDLPGAVDAPVLQGRIRFEGVSFAYEEGHSVLREMDLEVQPGERVALVGHSGIGKSTVASLLLRLYDPAGGRVTLDGRDLRGYTVRSLRAQMSVVLQENLLFAATVRENIALGVPGATQQEIVAAARLANAHEFIEALPKGYDTVLGERGSTLSGGQRQRIAIARAAIRRTPLLILDEPTAGLDEENVRLVTAALDRLATGRTTILITHDLQLAARADTVLFLEEGRVVERGSPGELLRSGGRFAQMARQQGVRYAPVASREERDALIA